MDKRISWKQCFRKTTEADLCLLKKIYSKYKQGRYNSGLKTLKIQVFLFRLPPGFRPLAGLFNSFLQGGQNQSTSSGGACASPTQGLVEIESRLNHCCTDVIVVTNGNCKQRIRGKVLSVLMLYSKRCS